MAPRAPDVAAAEYADVGVTWLFESRWPDGDWLAELQAAAAAGPGAACPVL